MPGIISMVGIIFCDWLKEGDAVGICMPGIISCDWLKDVDAVGICMSGIISMPGSITSTTGIISIPAILQTCSLLGRTVPANTLLPITSARIRDENRFSIAN